jgi:hypothetical protein
VKQDEPPSNAMELQAQIEILREERERERQQFQAAIDDLRRRLDVEAEERRRLTLILTQKPEAKTTALRWAVLATLLSAATLAYYLVFRQATMSLPPPPFQTQPAEPGVARPLTPGEPWRLDDGE